MGSLFIVAATTQQARLNHPFPLGGNGHPVLPRKPDAGPERPAPAPIQPEEVRRPGARAGREERQPIRKGVKTGTEGRMGRERMNRGTGRKLVLRHD